MKFTVSSSEILSILSTSGKVINPKNTLPILDYFLFDLKGNTLTVTASDAESTLVSSIQVADAEGKGKAAVYAKLVIDVLKEFSDMPITFHIDETTWEIHLSWCTGTSKVPGSNPVAYPSVKTLSEDKVSLSLDCDALIQGINRTLFATSDDDLRPVMAGIYLTISDNTLTCVATDAHKLAKYTTPCDCASTASFILPRKPAMLLRNLLMKQEGAVNIEFDSKNANFSMESCSLVCRLNEGNYPNYNAVIPTQNPNKVIVDRIELLNATKRSAVCASASTNLVRFDISDNKICIQAQDNEFAVSANETVSCSYDGAPSYIGFKASLLIEILQNLDTPSILIELADSARPGVFKPVYSEEHGSSVLMLLMPMMM